jgi:hypothetical protein
MIPPIISQLIFPKENVNIFFFGFSDTMYHLKNAEMTAELCDDLVNFSFDNLHDVFKNYQTQYPNSYYTIFHFVPRFLECLKMMVCDHPLSHAFCILVFFMIQPLSEADHICQTLQVHFDRMLCNVLEKYDYFPGFTLLLGSLFYYTTRKHPYNHLPGIIASLYLVQQQRGQYILDDIGFSEIVPRRETPKYITYFIELLESPERSGTHIFDQKQYTTAAKECLQLYLCGHRNFSKGVTEFAHHDKALCRNKPWEWVARLGVHSRIRKGRHYFKVRQFNSVNAQIIYQDHSYPKNFPKDQYLRSLSYQWALDLLPFFLKRSAISLELAEVLHSCTFTTMAWKFPRRRRLAKEAIAKYLLRVESAAGEA